MAAGVEAVIRELNRSIAPREILQRTITGVGTLLRFEAGRRFEVLVTKEFDDDYASGTTVGISDFWIGLQGSPDGAVTIKSAGIFSGIATR